MCRVNPLKFNVPSVSSSPILFTLYSSYRYPLDTIPVSTLLFDILVHLSPLIITLIVTPLPETVYVPFGEDVSESEEFVPEEQDDKRTTTRNTD